MNNHAHILIKTDQIAYLSKYMQKLNTRYARYYNKKYNRVGYVFRDRFKSQVIYSEDQLYNCIHYIFNNPVKAGLCSNAEDYPFSNYKKINYTPSDDYIFIDVDDDDKDLCQKKINEFLKDNKISLEDLINDTKKLKQASCLLKNKYHISFREISKVTKVNRAKLAKLCND